MKNVLMNGGAQVLSDVAHRDQDEKGVVGAPARYVCMVAYTDYTFDARVRREAETLAGNGFHVECLTTKSQPKGKQFSLNGVTVRELGVRKYRGKSRLAYLFSYLQFVAVASLACIQRLLAGRLDIVHAHNLPDFLVLAGLVPRLGGRKVVLDIHDSVPETFAAKFAEGSMLQRLLRWEERLSALVAHRVICVNQPQRDTVVARGIPASKTFISMNVPDPVIFRPAEPSAAEPDSTEFRLVYHGTMAERLGVDLIIRAVAKLASRLPNIRLHLWGQGDDLDAFTDLARTIDIEEHVLFRRGGYPLQELPAHLRRMHLGVIGNRVSVASDLMLPVKLMEYVALGIPAVAPRLRSIEHYFSDEMVTFYQPENVDSMAAAIERLHHDPERRRIQAKAALGFLTKYGWELQGIELVTFYRSLSKR
jgi:glycosyltransferase involved in cell wall biosynthesis